ncbi:hypothetical protein C8Q80DRAFT_1275453 [Daedaleopsis nitida]|nr:hypothetical protein C8Q80DRAFT_1275453 [Daedaleopsis nitida]
MFQLPQPDLIPNPATSDSGSTIVRPVIDVSEDSATLDTLLRLVYPVKNPELVDIASIEPVLEAAIKYDMEWPTELATERLLAVVPESPLQVWAIGCRMGLEIVARRGAEALLATIPEFQRKERVLLPDIIHDLDGMEGIFAGDYWRLLSFIRHSGQGGDDFHFLKMASSIKDNMAVLGPLDEVRLLLQDLPFHDHLPSDPADDVPLADIVCRCADEETVLAHRSILSLHSSVIAARIRASRSVDRHQRVILDFEESRSTLCGLLSLCYGVGGTLPHDPTSLVSLLAAGKKYRMSQVLPMLESQWESVSTREPFVSYCLTAKEGLVGPARVAGRKAVQDESTALPGQWYTPHMEDMSARAYHQLLDYYAACRGVLDNALLKAKIEWDATAKGMNVKEIKHTTMAPSWMSTHLERLRSQMDEAPSKYRNCLQDVFGTSYKSSPWCRKSDDIIHAIFKFTSRLPDAIEAAQDEVEWIW